MGYVCIVKGQVSKSVEYVCIVRGQVSKCGVRVHCEGPGE